MTRDPSHSDPGPFGPLPRGVTEADLLDWVEQRLPAARVPTIEAAIRTDHRLAAQLEEMRVDRAAIAGFGDEKAPANLIDAVEQALERHMLVGLASGEPLSDRPPVSIVRRERTGPFPFASVRGDAVGRRLALAAALLLVVGGASVMGVLAMRLAATSTPTPIATNLRPESDALPNDVVPAPDARSAPNHEIEIATNTAPILDESEPAETGAVAASEMTLARAVDLAREGRLIVRVRSDDIDRSLLRLGRMTQEPRNAWRLGEDAPQSVIAGLQIDPPRWVDPAIDPIVATWTEIPGFGAPVFPFPAIVVPRVEVERIIPTVFLGTVRPDEASLRGMLAALEATSAHAAAFEESPQPIPEAGPILDPDAVLWWEQEPSGWTAWARVPVVVTKKN